MNIIIADLQGDEVFILPHVPSDIEYPSESDNETMETLSGKIRIIGDDGLQSVSWSGILPVNKRYTWAKIGSLIRGYDYVRFIERTKKDKLPIRVVITDNTQRTIFNSLVSIDSFNYKKDKAQDISYDISVTEFPVGKWDYLNTSLVNNLAYAGLMTKSIAKQNLKKYGLI